MKKYIFQGLCEFFLLIFLKLKKKTFLQLHPLEEDLSLKYFNEIKHISNVAH